MLNYVNGLLDLRRMLKRAFWSEDKLQRFQELQLQKIVNYAYHNVPYYHNLFKELNISPNSIKQLTDLNKIPLLSKDQIIKDPRLFISKKFTDCRLQPHSTSGSTGKPLTVYINGREDMLRKLKHLRANISCGHKAFDKWSVITSPSHFGEISGIQKKLGIFSPIFVSVFNDPDKQLSLLKDINPKVVCGYSSSLLLLAREADSVSDHSLCPKIMFSGAELIDEASRKYIEDVFSAPLYDQYAIIELERIAWQCPEKIGYHLDSDMIISQFLDSDGNEVANNESGQIVCTSLFNYAMPLLRYAVGDIGVPSDESCPCGRSLPLMKAIEGRKDSLILLPDGRRLSPRTFTIAMTQFNFREKIEQFRIIQEQKNRFKIFLKTNDKNVCKSDFSDLLVFHLKKNLNLKDSIVFQVEYVEDMPLDKSGKFKLIHSEVKS